MITGKGFTIENTTPQIATIYPIFPDKEFTGYDGNYLVLDMGTKTKEDLLETGFMFKSDDLKITSTSASCGCTRPTFREVSPGEFYVVVSFDKNQLTQNVSKIFTMILNNNKSIRVNLLINRT